MGGAPDQGVDGWNGRGVLSRKGNCWNANVVWMKFWFLYWLWQCIMYVAQANEMDKQIDKDCYPTKVRGSSYERAASQGLSWQNQSKTDKTILKSIFKSILNSYSWNQKYPMKSILKVFHKYPRSDTKLHGLPNRFTNFFTTMGPWPPFGGKFSLKKKSRQSWTSLWSALLIGLESCQRSFNKKVRWLLNGCFQK